MARRLVSGKFERLPAWAWRGIANVNSGLQALPYGLQKVA
ncbi:hypothetical protein FHT86_004668 [Rhizobium sp. BK313]|nr:hypothetical protein [Rhizobium sp. BK313]